MKIIHNLNIIFSVNCRLGLNADEVSINPTRHQMQSSSLDLVLTTTKHKSVVMLEGRADRIDYQLLMKAIKVGTKACKEIAIAIESYQNQFGKPKLPANIPEPTDQEIVDAIRSLSEMRLNEVFQNYSLDKIGRDQAVKLIRDDVVNRVWSNYSNQEPSIITNEFNKILKDIFRELIFANQRCDGRRLDELRKISCEANLHEPLHGSALFQRGQTQVMATVSLDSVESAMKLDSLTSFNT